MTKTKLKKLFEKMESIDIDIDELEKDDIGHMLAEIEFAEENGIIDIEKTINFLCNLVKEITY